ncbi:VOC family protein [Kineosporia sp. A_224]|uniref:VOC family protein n=1 Tax=Kineosporia sp. A_224 TaxID=1962180 RepID=UPI000B4A98E5|nr:VOC family protein [Kineosporia sp. A_224]
MATSWQLTVDCADPARLVEFWCDALGYVPEPAPDGWSSWLEYWLAGGLPPEELVGAEEGSGAIVDPGGLLPRIWFQEVPEGRVVKNRLHLDLSCTPGRGRMHYAERSSRLDAEVARLVALGASVVRRNAPEGADYVAVTLQDPEGNEFCIS